MSTAEAYQNSPEQQKHDEKRFMGVVQSAMVALNQHPKAQEIKDDRGKPIIRSLVDDVVLPEGEARVWVKTGPSLNPKHLNQPVTSFTVADKVARIIPTWDGGSTELYPVTRVELYGDGTISVSLAETIEELEAENNPYGYGLQFDLHLETMQHGINQINMCTGLEEVYDDWQHVEHVDEAVEALLAK